MFKTHRFLLIIAVFLFVVSMGSCGGGRGSGGGGEGTTPPPTAENFTLSVDKFGDGVIVSDLSGINCGDDCSESYPSGTTVVLTATANTGSVFSYWAACDLISNNTCRVIMNGNKIVLPTFALSEFELQPTTKILDDATMQYLVRQEGAIYYFDPQATVISTLIPGDVIVSGSDKGFLRRVIGVSVSQDGLIALETEIATFEDVIEKGTVAFTEKLTYSNLKFSKAIIKGVSLRKPIEVSSIDFTIDINSVIYDADWDENTTWDQIKIIGNVTTSFEPDFALSIAWGLKNLNLH